MTNPGNELVRVVASEHLADIVFDVAEVAFDGNLIEGVFKEIPVLGVVLKTVKAGQTIANELFIRKLLRFLKELQSIPFQEREHFFKKYQSSSESLKYLGENLLLAIERLDNVEKPRLLARYFTAYIKSEINYTTFMRLASALEKFNLALLPNLQWFYTRKGNKIETPEEIIHELSLAGLVTVSLKSSGTIGGSANYFGSTIGATFLQIGFSIEVSPHFRGKNEHLINN